MIKKIDYKLIIMHMVTYILSIHYFVTVTNTNIFSFEDSMKNQYMSLDFFNHWNMSRFDITSISIIILNLLLIIKYISNIVSDTKGYHLLCLHRYNNYRRYQKSIFYEFNIKLFINYLFVLGSQIFIYIIMSFLMKYEIRLGNYLGILLYFIKLFIIIIICFKLLNISDIFGISYLSYSTITVLVVILIAIDIFASTSIISYGLANNDITMILINLMIILLINIIQNKLYDRKDLI